MSPSMAASTPFSLRPALAWLAMFSLVLLSIAAIGVGAGRWLNLLFPGSAFLVGLLLYVRYPLLYLGFSWWLWFLTPLVRRLVDLRSGFSDPSPILLTPFLVGLIASLTLLRQLPRLRWQNGLPFLLSIAGATYGYLVGLIKSSPVPVTIAYLSWLTPILLGFHLFIHWADYPACRRNLQRCFFGFALIGGLYGIGQFLVLPEWDRVWLVNVLAQGNLSFGLPQPLQVRVWSTLNSPGAFGTVMVAAVLVLFSTRGLLLPIAAVAGLLSLLMSAVRSGWIAGVIGLITLFPALKPRLQIRLLIGLTIAIVAVVPLSLVSPFSEVIVTRLQTFSNIATDDSAIQRQILYGQLLDEALSSVWGQGTGAVTRASQITLDSGLLDSLFSLGWFGSLFYMGGLLLLLLDLLRPVPTAADVFAQVARGITLGMVCLLPIGSIMLGIQGLMLWGFLGIGLAAQRYHADRRLAWLSEQAESAAAFSRSLPPPE